MHKHTLYVLNEHQISNTSWYAKVKILPYEKGEANMVGNILRRILLKSIDCYALQSVQIEGIQHEFSLKPGVRESIPQILSNLRQIVLVETGNGTWCTSCAPCTSGVGKLLAKHIDFPTGITCADPNQYIASIVSANTSLNMNVCITRSKTYNQASPHHLNQPFLPLDTNFNPVSFVNYSVTREPIRSGTQFECLFLEIWTNGSITPLQALAKASLVFRQLFEPFCRTIDAACIGK
jgi:DNA-directed RNA polymerase subunit alpha